MRKTANSLFLVLVFSFSLSSAWSQKKTQLDRLWLQLDALIDNANQPRAALDLLGSIAATAKKDHQTGELIRVAVYRLALQQIIEDQDPAKYVLTVDSLIQAADGPVESSLMTVLKARLLMAVYDRDRGKIMTRTAIAGGQAEEADIAYWTTADFQQKIHDLYEKALAPAELLQQTPNRKYNAILNRGNMPLLRPTLYDLILQDAIAYYGSSLALTNSSEQEYSVQDTAVLADLAQFAAHTFSRPDAADSLNSQWMRLRYYQALAAFHLRDQHPAALADLDLQRLDWAYDALTEQAPGQSMHYKELYRSALQAAIKQYDGTDGALYGAFQLADSYADDAGRYNPAGDTTHRFDYVKALDIIAHFQGRLAQAVKAAADTEDKTRLSPGAAGLLNLKNRIERPGFNLEMESVNLPDEPLRALVKFTNVSKLYFRILPLPVSLEELNLTDSLWKVMVNKAPLKSFSQAFPATGDFQQHVTEIKVPALENGSYLLLVSGNADFKTDSTLSALRFGVSRIAYASQGADLFFVNRKTGRPLSNVEVRLYNRQWNKKGYTYTLHSSRHTDANGQVTFGKENNNGGFSMMAIDKGDTLTSATAYYQSYSYGISGDEDGQKNMLFYLDRGIYRPGQQLFFKGIATIMYSDVRGRKLLKDSKSHRVYLYDANNQKVDSVLLSLNDYGALSGKFTLPQAGLAGNYSLGTTDFPGRQYFRVEEYKRPTYFVSFDTLKAAVALGDSVTVTGQAMAYSGYPVTDAKVNIVVNRRVYFPYRWYSYIPQVPSDQVAHGSVQTDEKGHFSFTFKAAGGEESLSRWMPNYHYSVEATSTDQNGETRDARTAVVVGAQPFNLNVGIPEDGPDDQLDTLNLITTTANGLFTPQQVSLRITRLTQPQRLIRERQWETPDLAVMDSISFVKAFPHDPYMDEANKNNWKRQDVVFEKQVMTDQSGKIALHQKIGPGWYEVLAQAPGNNGQTIKDRQYVYLYNPKSPLTSPVYNWSEAGTSELLPGQGSGITLASAAGNQYVIYSRIGMHHNKQQLQYGHITIDRKPVLIPLKLSETDIDGASLNYLFVRENRQYTGSLAAQLRDTATPPEVIYESFRDKTEPGSKERWTLHINQGDQRLQDMELLSSMYDASLDQFTSHDWTLPGRRYNSRIYSPGWQTGQTFSPVGSRANHVSWVNYSSVKTYDRFIYDELLSRTTRHTVFLRGGVRPMLAGRIAGLADNRSAAALDEVAVGYNPAAPMKKEAASTQAGSNVLNEETVDQPAIQPVRTNFRETAFFFPDLHTDNKGNYTVEFQMPDALTTWKWMNLAYDKDLNMVVSQRRIVSQKTLMVVPNLPRFVRNGDSWTLSAKLVNLSDGPLTGSVALEIEDPVSGQMLQWETAGVGGGNSGKSITVAAGSSATVRFMIQQPTDFTGPVNVTVRANGGQYSDAEQNILPVLTNRMLVTETLPIYLKGAGEKTFTLDKLHALKDNDGNDNKDNKQLVLELTSNPIWNVVMALPDIQLSEQPSALDITSKLYADAMGAYVLRTYPAIREVIEKWASDTASENRDALLSALEKNPELKSVLLQETPWVMDAQDEQAGHKALVRFFNQKALESSQRSLVQRLLHSQEANGGYSWFSGGRPDIVSTQQILSCVNELLTGRVKDLSLAVPLSKIAADAAGFLEASYTTAYEQWLQRRRESAVATGKRSKTDTLYPIGATEIQYLYAISRNPETRSLNEMQKFFLEQEKINWQHRSVYLQLMIAATQYRMGDKAFATGKVMTSLLDRAIRSEALGMYWKAEPGYCNWYENPLQATALAIRLLTEMGTDNGHPEWQTYREELQRFLISQKQVNRWAATKTTIDACVAMVDAAPEALDIDRSVEIQLGGKTLDGKKQAGTGYMRYVVNGKDIRPAMGKVTVRVKGKGETPQPSMAVYGALYWQYISPMRLVAAAANKTGISLQKALFRKVNTNGGKQLVPVRSTDILHVGDQLVSRLTVRLDRDMDYVHLREMRAAGVQPDQTVSGYQFGDGLFYYQTIGDLTTDLYFDHIAKGSYVIEYPVHVSHAGYFEAGTARMESFYAPEFSTHTEGIRIQVRSAQ